MSGAPAVRSDHWITVFICEIKFCNNFYFGDVSHLIIFAGVKRGGGGGAWAGKVSEDERSVTLHIAAQPLHTIRTKHRSSSF